MALKLYEWLTNLNGWKLILICFFTLIFIDMSFYYLNALFGRTTEPYPVLYEIIKIMKEPHLYRLGAG